VLPSRPERSSQPLNPRGWAPHLVNGHPASRPDWGAPTRTKGRRPQGRRSLCPLRSEPLASPSSSAQPTFPPSFPHHTHGTNENAVSSTDPAPQPPPYDGLPMPDLPDPLPPSYRQRRAALKLRLAAYHIPLRQVGRLALFDKPGSAPAFTRILYRLSRDVLLFSAFDKMDRTPADLIQAWDEHDRTNKQHTPHIPIPAGYPHTAEGYPL